MSFLFSLCCWRSTFAVILFLRSPCRRLFHPPVKHPRSNFLSPFKLFVYFLFLLSLVFFFLRSVSTLSPVLPSVSLSSYALPSSHPQPGSSFSSFALRVLSCLIPSPTPPRISFLLFPCLFLAIPLLLPPRSVSSSSSSFPFHAPLLLPSLPSPRPSCPPRPCRRRSFLRALPAANKDASGESRRCMEVDAAFCAAFRKTYIS